MDIWLIIFLVSYVISVPGFLIVRMILNRIPEACVSRYSDDDVWSFYKALFVSLIPIINVCAFLADVIILIEIVISYSGKVKTRNGIVVPGFNWLSNLNKKYTGLQ